MLSPNFEDFPEVSDLQAFCSLLQPFTGIEARFHERSLRLWRKLHVSRAFENIYSRLGLTFERGESFYSMLQQHATAMLPVMVPVETSHRFEKDRQVNRMRKALSR